MPFNCPECGRALPNFMNSGYQNLCTDCNPSQKSETHYYVEINPPDFAPISTAAHVIAVDRYNQDDRQHDQYSQQLYQYAKNQVEEHKQKLAERLIDCYRLRFAPEPVEFDIITVFPRSVRGKVSGELQDLAKELTSKFSVEYEQSLERTESAPNQKTLGVRGRWENHEGTLDVTEKVMNRNIILFDDICTSGSSLAWGTKKLLEAGASKVFCISLGLSYKQRYSVDKIKHSGVTVRDLT